MAKLHNTGVDIYDLLRMPDASILSQNETLASDQQARSAQLGALESYLNRPDVRLALHIPNYVQPYPPNSLNKTIQNNYQWHYEGSGWIQEILHKYGYRTLHIFGDTDG